MNEKIYKGKIQKNGLIKIMGTLPQKIKGQIFVAYIPKHTEKYHFGSQPFRWSEDNPIIENYKNQQKKYNARKKLMKSMEDGIKSVKTKGKVYISRNELYEERFKNL